MTTDTQTRRCIGSSRFGIEAHEAPADDFPVQPSQKDGLGRMCRPHWRAYTNALRKDAVARKTEDVTEAGPEPMAASPAEPVAPPALGTRPRTRLARPTAEPVSTTTAADAA